MTARNPIVVVGQGLIRSAKTAESLGAPVSCIVEGGGTTLNLGEITDGQFLKRSGTNLVSETPSGSGSGVNVGSENTVYVNGTPTATSIVVSNTTSVLYRDPVADASNQYLVIRTITYEGITVGTIISLRKMSTSGEILLMNGGNLALSELISLPSDSYRQFMWTGSEWRPWGSPLPSSDTGTTIILSTDDTVPDLQTKINAIPKDLNGGTLTFLFPNGTMDFSASNLLFTDFTNGTIVFQGYGSTATAARSNQSSEVTLRYGSYGLYFNNCACEINFISLKMGHSNTTTGSQYALFMYGCKGKIKFVDCCFVGTSSSSASYALRCYYCDKVEFYDCMFSRYYYCVYSYQTTTIYMESPRSIPTYPVFLFYASYGEWKLKDIGSFSYSRGLYVKSIGVTISIMG